MHTLPDLQQAASKTLEDLFRAQLRNLARECGGVASDKLSATVSPDPNKVLADLIGQAIGAEVAVHQGIVIVPLEHVEAVHQQLGSEQANTWPEMGTNRAVPMCRVLEELQLRMNRGELVLAPTGSA